MWNSIVTSAHCSATPTDSAASVNIFLIFFNNYLAWGGNIYTITYSHLLLNRLELLRLLLIRFSLNHDSIIDIKLDPKLAYHLKNVHREYEGNKNWNVVSS